MRVFVVLLLASWVLAGTSVQADNSHASLSFTPLFPSIDFKNNEQDKPQEARLNSGLGLRLQNRLLQFDVDYNLEVQLENQADGARLSQQLGAVLHSDALNRVLGVTADLRADSKIRQDGEAFSYTITPAISKSFSDLATFSAQYLYSLDQAGARVPEKLKSGYRLGLSGKTREGRLTWQGNYNSTDEFGGAWPLQSTELLEFKSRYQLMSDLRFEVSAHSRNEITYSGQVEHGYLSEIRYNAGLAWSPSQYYSMALKLNKLNETHQDQEKVFGSGNFSWSPKRELEFILSYGDHPFGGSRALMLNTNIDLNGP